MFNRAIGILPIFLVILILFGCQKSSHFNLEKITAIELDNGSNVVKIDDQNDISNIIKLMSTMKTETAKGNTAATKFYFITDSEKVNFDITDNCITVEDTVYKGFEQCKAIHNIFEIILPETMYWLKRLKSHLLFS